MYLETKHSYKIYEDFSFFLLFILLLFSVAAFYHLQNDKSFISEDFSEALKSFSKGLNIF